MKNKWMIGFEWGITGVALVWVMVLLMGGEPSDKAGLPHGSGVQGQR